MFENPQKCLIWIFSSKTLTKLHLIQDSNDEWFFWRKKVFVKWDFFKIFLNIMNGWKTRPARLQLEIFTKKLYSSNNTSVPPRKNVQAKFWKMSSIRSLWKQFFFSGHLQTFKLSVRQMKDTYSHQVMHNLVILHYRLTWRIVRKPLTRDSNLRD